MSVYNTAIEVLERLSEKNQNVIMLSDATDKLKNICAHIDNMIQEFDAETYTVHVYPKHRVLSIELVVPEIIVEECVSHGFFDVIGMARSFNFTVVDEYLQITFTFEDLYLLT